MAQFHKELAQLWFELERYDTIKLEADCTTQWFTSRNTLLYVLQGEGQIGDVIGKHEVQVGNFFFYPKEERIQLYNRNATMFIVKKIEFTCLKLMRKGEQWKLKAYDLPFWGSLYPTSPTITQHVMEMLCMKLDRRFSAKYVRDRALFYRLWEQLAHSTKKAQASNEVDIYQVAEMLKEHVKEKFVIEELARKVGLNVSEFFRRFKHQYGATPGQYLIEQRIRQSLLMLSGSNLKIMEIAHNVGYDDEYYFSRIFKKKLGISPAYFMDKTRKQIVVLSHELKDAIRSIGIKPCKLFVNEELGEFTSLLQEMIEKQPAYIFIPPAYEQMRQELAAIAPVFVIEGDRVEVRLQKMLEGLQLEGLSYEWLLAYHVSEQH